MITSGNVILTIYGLTVCLGFMSFSELWVGHIRNLNANNYTSSPLTWFFVVFFVNLAGLPPFPGFFIKMHLIYALTQNFDVVLVSIFLLINFTAFYFYTQFYKTIYTYSKVKIANIKKKGPYLYIATVFILVNFYPVYALIVMLLL